VQLGHGGLSRGPRLAFLLMESGTVISGTSALAVWHDRSGFRQRRTQRSRSGLQSAQNIGAALK
jgi:hypothetical protein